MVSLEITSGPATTPPGFDWTAMSYLQAVAYLRAGESREQAMRREALAVRTAAGLFDGGIEGRRPSARPVWVMKVHGLPPFQFLFP